MFRSKNDFITQYRQEGETTLACIRELTDESLDQAVSELDRTLGEITWHVVQSLGGFANQAGISVEGANFDSPMPETKAEILEEAEKIINNTLVAYEASLTDENLNDDVDFFGHNLAKGALLYSNITHLAHHRGQMTVLMRQAGLRIPGIYGPSRDSE
ncbi:damage-inducible protein DinB [Macrococcoides canis]|uniref:DinB family protein n=1 Tax=Macrococcoides canis TaxID=1855823 RepID=UPI0013E95945|nr:DinB family protein [Macrococcus canis]QIH75307.1 damage-inducible protein DinB [Macrococcus canis]